MNQKILSEYCSSCGLCASVFDSPLEKDSKGYFHPNLDKMSTEEANNVAKVCPATSHYEKDLDGSMWGKYYNVYLGNSKDKSIQYKASSGGILTSVAMYLLDFKKVDGVIHTAVQEGSPYQTETVLSTTSQELISRSGSRYAISSPLLTIKQYLDSDKKYCFIGKPCDVVVLRNYLKMHPEYSEKIPYMLSFFCAGLPSNDAQKKLIHELGFHENEVETLRYRGNGWPGYAKAIAVDGAENELDYNKSWGNILGRDIMKICRFCLDGIGELADISCGDAWYLNEDGSPDFSEHDGRNVIFARNENGDSLLRDAYENGFIEVRQYENIDELNNSQYHQYSRRATMLGQISGMRIMRKSVPLYDRNLLIKYAVEGKQYKGNLGRLKGIIVRSLKGSI